MKIIEQYIFLDELRVMARERFGDLVKAVVDIERGSQQKHLWGINLYPDQTGEAWVEFDSMINVRPSQGNRSRGVDDEELQKKIRAIVYVLTRSV